MKVTIEGEVFEYDQHSLPLHEAMALQKATGMRLVEWNEGLGEMDPVAIAGLIWLVWRRAGKNVKFADIESGAVPVDLGQFEYEPDEEPEPDPTGDAEPGEAMTS